MSSKTLSIEWSKTTVDNKEDSILLEAWELVSKIREINPEYLPEVVALITSEEAVNLVLVHDEKIRQGSVPINIVESMYKAIGEIHSYLFRVSDNGWIVKDIEKNLHDSFRAYEKWKDDNETVLLTEPAQDDTQSKCDYCHGTGIIYESHGSPYGSEKQNCPKCYGTGVFPLLDEYEYCVKE